MKKYIFLTLIPVILMSIIPSSKATSSKTLQELIDELNAKELQLKEISDEKNLTQEKLNEITSSIINVGLEINEVENKMIELNNKIEDNKIEIKKKEKQIKKLINLMQKNNGENIYLELLFGSNDLKDFIYRKQIIEQITAYNDKLVDDLNKMIEDSKELKIKLDDEKEALNEKNIELKKQQDELGLKVTMLDEDSRDVLEDLADAKKTINNYKKMGCLPTDSLESCSQIPTDSDFLRPLTQGVITSGYGTRENPVSGGYHFHAAVDIGGNPTGTSVYATASGRVVLTSYVKNPDVPNSSCGGNFVVIQHKIGNTYYASRYMHLSKIYVTENQTVTSNDIIGAVGGGEAYDRCSTGAHLDFSIAQGIYGKDFYLFRQPSTINPFTLVNLPNEGIYFTSRYLRY
mgnify:FL=1